ncbi:heavy metal-binding domain-containing protein [Flectobacillus major]|jgi:Cu2+-exporting ATPase|uniref:heavy metal-binding domain-containing protein n=1 Tax=Flectobacillus major TaxID=103 RepID=UPI0004156202|nr:heavy metal-binding domain-containing protein [Flectobacillus major]
MKKIVIGMLLATTMMACGGKETAKEETTTVKADSTSNVASSDSAAYQCPMKCEGEKTYTQAGKCPTCGMDLAEVSKK